MAIPSDTSAYTAAPARNVALLGPQHQGPIVRDALDQAGAPGPYVLVAAGWEEREAETGALEEHLGAGVTNLGLWPACEAAFEQDSALQDLMFSRFDRMRELSHVYRVRLSAELESLRTLLAEASKRGPDDDLVTASLPPAFDALRALDTHHVARVAELNDRVFAEAAESPVIVRERERVAEMLAGAGTLLVAGGHVGILYNRMRLFGVIDRLPQTASIVGWSAGAMVLTDRIMLFHDSPPQGAGDAEVHGPGFGVAPDVAVLPHADSRLRLDDSTRVALLARRMEPSQVVALDVGEWLRPSDAAGSGHGTSPAGHGASPAAHGASPAARGASPAAHGASPAARGASPAARWAAGRPGDVARELSRDGSVAGARRVAAEVSA